MDELKNTNPFFKLFAVSKLKLVPNEISRYIAEPQIMFQIKTEPTNNIKYKCTYTG